MKTILYNKKSLLLFNFIILLFFSTRQYFTIKNVNTDFLILPLLVPALSIMKLSSKQKILKCAIIIMTFLIIKILNIITTQQYIILSSFVLIYSIFLIYKTSSLKKPDIGSINLFVFINSFLISLLLLCITEIIMFSGFINSEKTESLIYFLQIVLQFYIIFYSLVLIIDNFKYIYHVKKTKSLRPFLKKLKYFKNKIPAKEPFRFNKLYGPPTDLSTSYIINELKYFFENSNSYYNTNFTLMDLSKELDVPANQISRVINTELHSNFYKLVSFYRIAKAKTLLEEFTVLKIDAISEQVGFKSRITFNKYFKHFTGLNPAQYRLKIEKTNYKYS